MAIAFECPNCGASYQVDARLAGRKARCKSCQGSMRVPTGAPAGRSLAAVAAGVALAHPTAPDRMFPTNIGLAPLDESAVIGGPRETQKAKERKFSYNPALDDPSSAALPQLVPTDIALPRLRKQGEGRPPSELRMGWRRTFRGLIKLFRSVSDLAYLITVPCILAFLIGVLLRREALAFPAAVAIVVLNIGRLVLNGLALVAVAFKDGPLQGLMFVVPPFTLIYLAQHWKKIERAFLRFLGPAVPILIVAGAFLFIPWLHTGGQDDRVEQMRKRAEAVKSRVAESDLGTEARQGVESLRQSVESAKQQRRDGSR